MLTSIFFTGDQTEVHRLLSNQHLINNKLYDERLYWPPSELIHAGVYISQFEFSDSSFFTSQIQTHNLLLPVKHLNNERTVSTLQYFY